MSSKLVGNYKYFPNCRFCGSKDVQEVINLGYVPLAGGFFKKGTSKDVLNSEKFYPLTINFCQNCYLLQCNNSIAPDTLFKDYFYFSSSIKTLVDHFGNIVSNISQYIPKQKSTFVVEIGCNDGAFIRSLLKNGYTALGVDPAKNVTDPLIKKGLPIINNYFSEKLAKEIVKKHGNADAIYSFHTMAHIENMHDVFKGIKTLLKKDGYLAFEVHYLGDLIRETQYDMIYHEHQFYYSLLSLKKFFAMFDMEVFDVKHTPIRAGSMMYFVQNKTTGKRKISPNVRNLVKQEKAQKLDKIETYTSFANYISKTKANLLKTITSLKKQNKTIVGYGASGRGTIIMNYCDLDKNLLDYVVDDAPAKHGSYTPGTHQKIFPSSVLSKNTRPDYAVLFAWPFIEEVLLRNQEYVKDGGKFIVPLPKVKIT